MSAKEWYLRQSQRDRLIVVLVAALVILGLGYVALWAPLGKSLESNRLALQNNQTTIQRMLQTEAEVKALRGSGNRQQVSNKPPYLLVDEVIRQLKMSRPERVEPIDNTGARVNFTEVEFDKLIVALARLEENGLLVSTLNISRKRQGMVGARFRVDRSI